MRKRILQFTQSVQEKVSHYGSLRYSEYKGAVLGVLFVGLLLMGAAFGYFSLQNNSSDLHGSALKPSFDFGPPPSDVFSDVSADHPHAYALAYLKGRGMIVGFDDGTFRPDETMNRAVFMKMLTESLRAHPHRLRYGYCYSDVQGEWFAPFVCFAKKKGWVEGDDTSAFVPDRNVTRAEALKIVTKAFDVKLLESSVTGFEDVGESDWYYPYVVTAESKGWFQGFYDEFHFEADAEMTRAEVAELLFRAFMTELPVY